MSIAFYDYDIYLKPTKIMLNLEAMKIASYYKNKGQAIYLIDNINTIDQYDQAFVFRNVMPKSSSVSKKTIDYINSPNVNYIGNAYTGGIYLPIDSKYEKEIAFPGIYWSYFKNKMKDGKLSIPQIEKYINSHYLRLRAGDHFLKLDGLTRKEKVFIYDKEIEQVPDWEMKLEFCSKELKKDKNIHVVNRFQFTNPANVIKLSKIQGFTSDDVELEYNCSYMEFKTFFEDIYDWASSRNGIHYTFGNVKNPSSLLESTADLVLSINKYFVAKSMHRACTFVVSDKSDISQINRLQKAFQYWTDIRVGDENLKQYFKKRLNKDFDELYGLVLKTPYGKQFDELCSITKNDIKEKGWYYRG